MTTYRAAPAVARIAADLITRYHHDLDGVEIRYVFRDPVAKTKGRTILGAARKVTGLNAYLAGDQTERGVEDDEGQFFVIEIAERPWGILNAEQRVALVDHELSHCTTEVDDDGTVKLLTVGHDYEDFTAVLERHGFWHSDAKDMAAAMVAAAGLTVPDHLLGIEEEGDDGDRSCFTCQGTGRSAIFDGVDGPCGDCDGTGRL